MTHMDLAEATTLAKRLQAVAPLSAKMPPDPGSPPAEGFLDSDIASSAPNFIQELVSEVNVTFATGCYTACAMLLRRLTETLLVEAFVRASKEELIQNETGDWLTLEGIIAVAEKPTSLGLTRTARNALATIKKTGDLCAHDRHFIAKKQHLARQQMDIDAATQGLLAVCGFR